MNIKGDKAGGVWQLSVDCKSAGYEKESVWKIITKDLGMRKACAKLVPKLLKDDQKVHLRCL